MVRSSWFSLLIAIPLAAVATEIAAPVEIKRVVVRPIETDEVLINPGIGFTTFQRFNGDSLEKGTQWPEGYWKTPDSKSATQTVQSYPNTSLAYLRLYWKAIEPQEGRFDWSLIDAAIEQAKKHGQSLILRLMPYGDKKKVNEDVPAWYRAIAREKPGAPLKNEEWRIDHEKLDYLKYFGRLIGEFGARYDGNPFLDSVDVAMVGPWGEGAGSKELSEKTYNSLRVRYLDSFKRTTLVFQTNDLRASISSRSGTGVRVDCLGDVGGFSKTWSHMYDLYPQEMSKPEVREVWKSGPVQMEACWVMKKWAKENWNLDYVIEQSLKWHISSFNAKSSAVPARWKTKVDSWLKKMGYRLVLRKFTYPEKIKTGGELDFTSWWENKGVAPPYRDEQWALRFSSDQVSKIVLIPTDLRTWLPGDVIQDGTVKLPADLIPGQYQVELALVDAKQQTPTIQLAIRGKSRQGWYPMGKLTVIAQ